LGLSIVHGIIEKHKGEITVESELGKGSIFRIVLPVRQE
jgi:two-component system NtrC family sensor kinase